MEDYDEEELRLDREYTQDVIQNTNSQHKQDMFERRCLFAYTDIRNYLEKEGLDKDLFKELSVERVMTLFKFLRPS